MMPRRPLLIASLWVAMCPVLANAATPTLSVTEYRGRLERAKTALDQQRKRPPVNVTKILSGLKNDVIVKRSDGSTQLVRGDEWASRLAVPRDGANPAALTGQQARELREAFIAHLKSLDEWSTPRDGAFYQPADAQAIVTQLEATGQIRTKPLWLQSFIAKIKKWFSDTVAAVFKWLGSLLPTRAPSAKVPDLSWLWFVFWAFVVAILGVIFYFVYNTMWGRWGGLSWFGIGRRKKAKNADFEGEDAELLLLPPDELRQRAERFAAQGNFREALRHRFIALLLHLDGRGVWRYDVRRTNWEHIGALRREAARLPLVAPLSDLTQRFDRVRYGGADCSPADWSQFQHDVQGLETQVGTTKVAEVAR